MTARIIYTVIAMLLPAVIAWSGGYNFKERGFWAAWTICASVAFGILTWHFPGWNR